ncbi:MAG: aminoglycoside phosphotransferase [Halobacteriovoraceae bacterium]|nr:aminoglycoside phosphotransferase [Halobacteriovoraceae bacterium]
MKPEVSERLFIEELFKKSMDETNVDCPKITNVERLTGDASTRRYYRVHCSVQSYVVCLDNPSQDEFNSFVETQKFFEKHDIKVPKVIHTDLSKGYLLEEDLGDETLLKALSSVNSKEAELSVFKDIIEELVKIHSIPLEEVSKSHIGKLKFDFEKLINEIDFTVDYFVGRFLGVEDEGLKRSLIEEFYPVCKRLSSQKMVCTHRDFHSRNIMVTDDKFMIIDFQDARLGIPQYDLASLLEDCYYDLNAENRELLKRMYFESLPEEVHGQKSVEEFQSLYRDMLLQRVFKAVGSFAYIYHHRKDHRYLKYIGFAMEKLKLAMLDQPDLKNLKHKLFDIYYDS